MELYRVIPIHEIVKIIESRPVSFVGIIPFLERAIALRMLDSSFDMPDLILFKKIFKSAILRPVFCLAYQHRTGFRDLSSSDWFPSASRSCQELLEGVRCCSRRLSIEFAACKDTPRTIVEKCTHLLPLHLLVCQSKCTRDSLCSRSYLTQGFLRFALCGSYWPGRDAVKPHEWHGEGYAFHAGIRWSSRSFSRPNFALCWLQVISFRMLHPGTFSFSQIFYRVCL